MQFFIGCVICIVGDAVVWLYLSETISLSLEYLPTSSILGLIVGIATDSLGFDCKNGVEGGGSGADMDMLESNFDLDQGDGQRDREGLLRKCAKVILR